MNNNDRQQDRRQPGQGDLLPPKSAEEKRKAQRREYFRVVYPIQASPEITNLSAKVIDISVTALRFELLTQKAEKANLTLAKKIKMEVKFHDGQLLKIEGTITRMTREQFSNCVFVCMFEKPISSEIITKEQSYLLKNFPDFCRKKFIF